MDAPLDLITVVPPATEPISLSEAKLHCRVDGSAEDTLIEALIQAATRAVEEMTGRALIAQTLELRIDCWPALLYLPRPPAASISSITYTDDDGAVATLDAAAYTLRTGMQPAYIRFDSTLRPSATLAEDAAIVVRYVAGYGAANDVPMPLRQAMLLLIGHWYNNREAVGASNQASLPFAVESLIAPYRVFWFGEWAQ